MRSYKLLFFFISLPILIWSQGVGLPLGNPAYHMVDRLDIKTDIHSSVHTSLKYYSRGDVTGFAIAVDTSLMPLTIKDRRDLYYIFKDNNDWLEASPIQKKDRIGQLDESNKIYIDSSETFYTYENNSVEASKQSDYYVENKRPILRYFYKTPANLWEVNNKFFYLKANPILNAQMYKENDNENPNFVNTRGVSIRGGVDNKVYFYSRILENQVGIPRYVNERIERDKALPGAGLFKNYESSVWDKINGYDYLTAQGYFGVNISRHVGLQLGHGRNFIGNGYRSLLLSDQAANYFYLKLNTRVWRFHYQNIFAELSSQGGKDDIGDNLIPKKYFAAHYLSFKFSRNLSIGLFESVVFNRQNHFEFQYLNPIILYRSVEQAIGSPDNAMIGMDFKWNFLKRFSLYGQILLDEFLFEELAIDRNGWWANKNGVQLGLKYIDVLGVDHLDAQFEFNTVRPYTYTHSDTTSISSYTHYNQPLAHPMGANFKEYIFRLRYQATKKLSFDARLMTSTFGEDRDSTNWGSNVLLSNRTREQEYGNEVGQGVQTKMLIAGLDVSYQVFHNMFIDLSYFYRNKNSESNELDLKTSYVGGGIRINLARNRRHDF